MLMWADRLLDDKTMGYGKWESSANGTAPAIDKIPTDIILCDWHYELRDHYPSVAYFQQKGFRVWPASWNNPKAALALLEEGRRVNKGLVIGHLGTTWLSATAFCRALLEPGGELPKGRRAGVQGAAQALRACMNAMKQRTASVPDAPPKGKWTSLFNGKDLTGWYIERGHPSSWRIEAGELVAVGHNGFHDMSFLLT